MNQAGEAEKPKSSSSFESAFGYMEMVEASFHKELTELGFKFSHISIDYASRSISVTFRFPSSHQSISTSKEVLA